MADVSKAQKLASARRKFKELKKEKKKSTTPKINENVESIPTSREQTPVENVTNIDQETTEQLPNYFNIINYNNGFQQTAAFFDTFVKSNEDSMPQSPTENQFHNNYFYNETVVSDENAHSQLSNLEDTDVTESAIEDTKPIEDANDFYAFDNVKFDQNTPQPPQLSSAESLRQLTDQMAELINPSSDPTATFQSQLEIRNQELVELLNQEKSTTAELSTSLQDHQDRIRQLQAELKDRVVNTDTRIEQEISSLREELQCHVQTVGILVAEKAELVANLSQFQLAAKMKTSDCEELQGRLKTSRSRVADVEREIALLKSEKSQYDNLGKEQHTELEKLMKDRNHIKEEKDELMQDLLEVREKLKSSSENNLVFQQQIAELSNQLSMANIKIQQLTAGEQDQASGQVEQLTQEKFALEKQITDLAHTVKTLSKEREESSLQYQQYAQQLNAQLSNMAGRLEKLQKENESLSIQEQNRIKHIGELEKQLQNLQNDQINFAVQRNNSDSRADLDGALELVEKLKSDNIELQESNIKIVNEKDMLLKDLEAKVRSIRELEGIVEELRGNQPDSAKLLAIMESDKVAAARAVSQNTELKKEMESMQEVFMKLNNDKMELTEKITTEQRNNKDLFEKLQKTELHLQTLADAIEIKDKELSHLRENSVELNKHVLQSEQLTDRLRHYEAQDHSTHPLQQELQEARQIIAKLTAEINHLNETIEKSKPPFTPEENTNHSGENVAINENEMYHKGGNENQIVELQWKLENLEMKNKELEAKLSAFQDDEKSPPDNNHNDQWDVLDKESAMKHLEKKFLKTMEDIANLTEEKQRLEHLVLQLQGETETIGEYVALYQQQRSLLKQKAIEKDQQLSQLANDREQMKSKLEKLNDLVGKLVLEKGAVPSELLEHHNHDNHFCEEHAKIHKEINKITQNNLTIEPSNCDSPHSTETAEQIISLLSEIKNSNLVQPTENFHHCPWCSGQLITV